MTPAQQLLATHAFARLRALTEQFSGLPMCQEIAQHPRDGRRPCLTVLDSIGQCANVHRHEG